MTDETEHCESDAEANGEIGEKPEGPVTLSGCLPISGINLRLVQQARREVLIFSTDLEPDLYDQGPFVEAVRRFCLGSLQMPVRVLLRDPRAVAVKGHRFVSLARQLTSRIAIRRLAEDFKDRQDAFLIADGRGYCVRHRSDAREAVADLDGPPQARLLQAEFEHMWERSDVDSELRRLFI